MGLNDDFDEKKLDQNERDTKRKKAKVKGKVTGAVLKMVFLKVILGLAKVAFVLMIFTTLHDFFERILGPIRTENMPKETLSEFNIEKIEEEVKVKGDEENGYYLGYDQDFDDIIKELAERFKKEHNLLRTDEETVEKLMRAQFVSQFPNLGGSISQEELDKKLEEQEAKLEEEDKEGEEEGEDDISEQYGLLWWPLPLDCPITSDFGPRPAPLPGASTNHGGVDIGCPEGTIVRATQSGTVIYAGENGNAGIMVAIDHGGGYTSTYMHNSELLVSSGQKVARGDPISKSGNTGNSAGPHLHFQIEKNGVKVDPEGFKYQNYSGKGTKTFGTITNLNGFLFIGDSITEGIQENTKLKDSITYKAVSGSKPSEWLNDKKHSGKETFSSLPDDSKSIKGISLMLGTNDVSEIEEMKKLIVKIHEKYPEKTIYVNKILPFPNSKGKEEIEQRKKFVKEIEEYCKTLSYVTYIDATEGVELRKNNVHPTDEGYEQLAKNIKKAILEASVGSNEMPEMGIEADNSYVSKYDGFQGNIKIRRVTPNKELGEVKNTGSGSISETEVESFSSDGLGTKQDIPENIKQQMEGVSMQNLTGITYDELSYLTIPHYDFYGNIKNGHMVVNKKVADEVLLIFQELYKIKYPIERMEIVDNFTGSDHKTGTSLDFASIEANNTSAFNDRMTAGGSNSGKVPSKHADGLAIDINPQINPYINDDGSCSHENAKMFTTNRGITDPKPGWTDAQKRACITKDAQIYKIFEKYGWKWLGTDDNKNDTQHFYRENTENAKKIPEEIWSQNGETEDTEDGGSSGDNNTNENDSDTENSETNTTDNKLEQEIATYIENTATSGKWGVYVKSLKSNDVVVNINNEKLQSASLIKLFIMATTFNEIYKGNISLESVEADLKVMITHSDNDATNRLIDKLGFDKINQYIKANGYTNTEINRKMLASKSSGDNYTSAKDVGKILEEIMKGRCVSQSASSKMLSYLKQQTLTEKIPAGVPDGVETANKTGELDNVENDGAIVFKDGSPYIIVVMSNDVNDTATARKNIVEISKKVYKGIEDGGVSSGINTGESSENASSSINSKVFDLKFVTGSIFEQYVANNDPKALEVFTIDYEGQLLTAKWSYDSSASPPLKIIKNSPINIKTVMQKYTTTYEYLLDFWADIKEEDFINAFADMVLDSEFVIAIEDNVNTNAKEVVTTINGEVIGEEVTVTETVSDTIELTYADNWFITVNKEFDYATTIQGTGLTADPGGSLGQFRTTTYCFGCNDDGSGNFGTTATASGVPATVNHTIAVCPEYFSDPNSPLAKGKQVLINGVVYTVEDTGGGCNYFGHNWIDIYVESCDTANVPDYQEVFIPENIRDANAEGDTESEDNSKEEDKDNKEDDKEDSDKKINTTLLKTSFGNFAGKVTSNVSISVSENQLDENRLERVTTTNTHFSCKYETGTTKAKFKVEEFLKVFDENPEGLESIKPKWLIDLVQENAAYMTDITKYLLNKLMGEEIFEGIDLDRILERFEDNSFSGLSGFAGDSIQEKVWFALLDLGYSKEAAAGVLGNIEAESGFNPNVIEGGSGIGFGLCQWSFGRRTQLEAYAASKGRDPGDINTQIEFLIGEITPGGGADGFASYQLLTYNGYSPSDWENATTPEEAAIAFCWSFERPGVPRMDVRTEAARRYYEELKDKKKPMGGDILEVCEQVMNDMISRNVHYSVSEDKLIWHDIAAASSAPYACCATYVSSVLYHAGLLTEDQINAYNYHWTGEGGIPDMLAAAGWTQVSHDDIQPGDVINDFTVHVLIYAGGDMVWDQTSAVVSSSGKPPSGGPYAGWSSKYKGRSNVQVWRAP